jgi:peroxiredoxin
VTKLAQKPFALVGVNGNRHEPQELKAIMDQQKLPWRSLADKGAINARWNNPATPTYYVIDPKGVIRHKWTGNPGEGAIDKALDKLIQEAEAGKKNAPK